MGDPSVQRLEWQSLLYVEEVHRWHDGLKLRKRWTRMETIQEERGDQLPGAGVANIDVDPGEPGLSGDTAIIVLDGGRIVEVLVVKSLVRNARTGDLPLHFWRKFRTKRAFWRRSFWRLGASFLEEVLYETLVLETWHCTCGAGLRPGQFVVQV